MNRVVHLRIGTSTASGFALDIAGRQYLITARHFAKALGPANALQIFHGKEWKDLPVAVVGHAQHEVDISVLAASQLVANPALTLVPSQELYYSQDVYFVGYPYGWFGDVGQINQDWPIPFAKKAIVSCLENGPNGELRTFLDGHNNVGFSGGPVVFRSFADNKTYCVASVIAGYRYVDAPVFVNGMQAATYQYNTGIIVSYGIKHAVDLIEANPIGFAVAYTSSCSAP